MIEDVIEILRMAFLADTKFNKPTIKTLRKLQILIKEAAGENVQRSDRIEFLREVTGLAKIDSSSQITQHTACILITWLETENGKMDALEIIKRTQLKARIAIDRSSARGLPLCAYCNEGIRAGADMHEAILSRAKVPNDSRIMVEENCVLVHHGECHDKAATQDGKVVVVKHILKYTTAEKIFEWLDGLGLKSASTVNEAKALVREAQCQMEKVT